MTLQVTPFSKEKTSDAAPPFKVVFAPDRAPTSDEITYARHFLANGNKTAAFLEANGFRANGGQLMRYHSRSSIQTLLRIHNPFHDDFRASDLAKYVRLRLAEGKPLSSLELRSLELVAKLLGFIGGKTKQSLHVHAHEPSCSEDDEVARKIAEILEVETTSSPNEAP